MYNGHYSMVSIFNKGIQVEYDHPKMYTLDVCCTQVVYIFSSDSVNSMLALVLYMYLTEIGHVSALNSS